MIGGDQARFCGQCQLNVYNLSAMSKFEAEALIARTEGRLCVRFYRRKDGSILTDNCPIGLRALKRRAFRIKTAVASSILLETSARSLVKSCANCDLSEKAITAT